MNDIATTRRGALSKQRILDATIHLLQTEDYQTVSLDRIAREAGIAKSSVLWHFESKELLVTEAVQRIFTELEQELLETPLKSDCPVERLSELFDYTTRTLQKNPTALAVILGIILTPQRQPMVREQVARAWKRHQKSLLVKLSTETFTLTPEMSASVLAMIHGCYIQWYVDEFQTPIRDILQSAVDLLRKLKTEKNELKAALEQKTVAL
ncbi:TetR/AcrR family transcriptional regulator [Endozoicomonadaceae bacterium StTr2]